MRGSNRWLVAASALALLCASACFKDWDRVDPSKGTPPVTTGGTGGTAGEGGEEPMGGDGGTGVCSAGDQAPCYSGPMGTENVGECTGGVTTCNDDGNGFGPCVGEVIPASENCENALDDDCDGEVNELDAGCTCTPGALTACYDGPAGTEGMGICKGGQKMCEASGNTETACAGQTLPLTEECLTVDDDDCDGTANGGCPTSGVLWGGSAGDDSFAWDVAVDASNGYALVGQTEAVSIDLGGGALTPQLGTIDALIARYDSSGNEVWSRRIGGANNDIAYGVAFDDAGDVYVAGYFSEVLDVAQPGGADTTAGLGDVFIGKFDGATGANIWLTQLGDASEDFARSIAVNGAGTVIAVTGWFEGSIDVGDGLVATTDVDRDGFVVVLDGNGAVTTAGQTFGGVGEDEGRTIALDGTNVIVGGSFDESVSFGVGAPIIDVSSLDGFVAKLDSAGGQTWLNRVGGNGDEVVYQVVVDSGSSVIAHGDFDTNIDFGGGATMSQGSLDAFVVKYASGGAVTWELPVGGPGDQGDGALAVDGNDNIWFATSHEDSADYGGGLLFSAGNDDWAVIKLDPAGAYLKSLRFGNGGDEDPRAMAAFSDNSMILVGETTSGIDLGLGNMPGSSSNEAIVVAILPP